MKESSVFLGITNKHAKTVVLHIDGLDDTSRRNLCEEALLKIKGVISFTFQIAVQNPFRSECRGFDISNSINQVYDGSASCEK